MINSLLMLEPFPDHFDSDGTYFPDGAHEAKLEFLSVGYPSRVRADSRELSRHRIMVLRGD